MFTLDKQKRFYVEIMLLLVSVALTCLLYEISGYKMIVLNLYFLPVVLAAFFLGRYRAGVLAVFCVIAAFVVTVMDLDSFATYSSPLTTALSVTVWGAILALTTLLVGTLSDERSERMVELHDAYLGIVEVLSGYLASADPGLKDRARRVADLGRDVATTMKLSPNEVDDIRVAAMLQGLEHVEVTAKVIRKALGDLGRRSGSLYEHKFRGSDLAQSLGEVLAGALPLVADQDAVELEDQSVLNSQDAPFGSKIIETVKRYDTLVYGRSGRVRLTPEEALKELRVELDGPHHPAVLGALEKVVRAAVKKQAQQAEEEEPELITA